jgi:hypothetical protein
MGTEKLRAPDSSGIADHDEVERCLVGSGNLPGVDEERGCVVRGLKFVLYGKIFTCFTSFIIIKLFRQF